jgi:protein ImuA
MPQKKTDIISQLRTEIHRMEGFKPAKHPCPAVALGTISEAFPTGSFPLGAVHEFLSAHTEDLAAVNGFIAGLLSHFITNPGAIIWISADRTLFPPALKTYGIQPDRIIFVDASKEKDVLPLVHEALKYSAISAVVGETNNLDFTTSRRLQLAVEQSQVTAFVIRNQVRKLNTTACVLRWRISSLPSEADEGLPGIGFQKWRVELLRMRNGKTGVWDVQWIDGKFASVQEASSMDKPSVDESVNKRRKVG